MTKIKPFNAIVYNQQNFKDLSAVVCPPYDVISPLKQQYYHDINPYNFIHILLGKDITGEDKYRRAKDYFNSWLKNKVLIQEEKSAIYFYSQQFNLKGEKRIRLGFIALLHLENKRPSVFGHERTRLESKEDRLRLLRQVKANLSPIFVIFSDRKRIIQRIYQQCVLGNKPYIDIVDDDKVIHKLWRIEGPEILTSITSSMAEENIFIADGHHRYEVACNYQEEMKKKQGAITGDERFNYILAYFTDAASRGLMILPIHRLVKLDYPLVAENFREGLKEYFAVEEVKDKNRFFFLMEKAGRAEHILGMYQDKKYWLLRLKNIKILDKMIGDKPHEYRSLDIAILNYLVLRKILGLDLENKDRITFSTNADELIEQVDNSRSYIACFLNPVKVEQIMSVALTGEKMPSKSTYFYPKVLSGLVINKFNEATTYGAK
jgi:uncharacterized protein (DUF1015 family)